MSKILRRIEFVIGFLLPFIVNVFVLTIVWGWFITPAFGLQQPKYAVMLGLVVIFKQMTFKPSLAKRTEKKLTPEEEVALSTEVKGVFWRGFWASIQSSIMFFGIMWLIHLFV